MVIGLVMAAYDLAAPRVIGPGSLDGNRFDIVAKGSREDSQDELRANTGLEGRYDFSLAYKPEVLRADGGTAEFGPPDLFTAIQEQMGLRLMPTKASLSVVVVDQMDRVPTEN
jgi:hypothetical protein